MSDSTQDQLMLMAQMTSESNTSDLKSFFNQYLPIAIFIIFGIITSTLGVFFTKQWEYSVESSISNSIKKSYIHDIHAKLELLQHNTEITEGFIKASDYINLDEYRVFSEYQLHPKHNHSTDFSLLIGYSKNESEHYFQTKNGGKKEEKFNAIMNSRTTKKILSEINLYSGRYHIIKNINMDLEYLIYVKKIITKDGKEVIMINGASESDITSDFNEGQASLEITINDSLNNEIVFGKIKNDNSYISQQINHENLSILLKIDQNLIKYEIFSYFRWIVIIFSILTSAIFSFQYINAKKSIKKFVDLTIKRANDLTLINSDLVDEIMERAKLQTELITKNSEISDANKKLDEARNQLIQKEKLASLGQLSAGIAHEINNPIGFVKSNLSTLKKYSDRALKLLSTVDETFKDTDNDDVKEIIDLKKKELKYDSLVKNMPSTIDESLEGIDRIKRIIHDLKMFSRIEDKDFQPTNIHDCINSTLNILRCEIKDTSEIHKDYGDIPETQCVASQINQVILNLLMNSIHAISSNGNIYIKTFKSEGYINIEIADDGKGIDSNIIDKIFDPFFTTKDVGEGTGLGLSLSYGIIEQHSGVLAVESTLGVGTKFTIKLPINHNISDSQEYNNE